MCRCADDKASVGMRIYINKNFYQGIYFLHEFFELGELFKLLISKRYILCGS